jgi:hypothetical protein
MLHASIRLILTSSPNLTALYQTCPTRKTGTDIPTHETIRLNTPTHQDTWQLAIQMVAAKISIYAARNT